MRAALSTLIQHLDALEFPAPGSPALPDYKEWLHFNILDVPHDLYAIVNIALTGDIYNEAQGSAFIGLMVYHQETDWVGNVDWYPMSQVKPIKGQVDVSMGQHSLCYKDRRFWIQAALQDGSLEMSLALSPKTMLIPMRNDIPFGRGWLDWIILPRLSAQGSITFKNKTHSIRGALAYHDHNRGYWQWDDTVGWDWGFAIQPSRPEDNDSGSDALTVVFNRSTDRYRHSPGDRSVLVWRGQRFLKLFLKDDISFSYRGEFKPGDIYRVPRVMDLLSSGDSSSLPGTVLVQASNGPNHLEIAFCVESASQILIPQEAGGTNTAINELLGTCKINGRLEGKQFSFSCRTFMEYVE
jgi:hypothetical protein